MKAVVYSQYGSTAVLNIKEVAPPPLQPDGLLIENHASSINPVDWKIRRGKLRLLSGIKPPALSGSDFAGKIIQLGHNVSGYKVGDRVYGYVNPLKGGAFAEILCAPQQNCSIIPDNLNYIEAASLPISVLTAYYALKKIAQLKPTQRIIINGCSGGVGVMAVQMAKMCGAYVIGVCSQANHPLALSLEADEVIDYHSQPNINHWPHVDVFFDVVSNRSPQQVKPILSDRGIYINTIPSPISLALYPLCNSVARQQKHSVMAKPNGTLLTEINQWIAAGNIRPVIEKTFSLEHIAAAQRLSEAGHVKGKLAIAITADSTMV